MWQIRHQFFSARLRTRLWHPLVITWKNISDSSWDLDFSKQFEFGVYGCQQGESFPNRRISDWGVIHVALIWCNLSMNVGWSSIMVELASLTLRERRDWSDLCSGHPRWNYSWILILLRCFRAKTFTSCKMALVFRELKGFTRDGRPLKIHRKPSATWSFFLSQMRPILPCNWSLSKVLVIIWEDFAF